MTYAELITELQALDPARLQDTVTVYVRGQDEFYAVNDFQIAVDDGVLDDGHAYLEVGTKTQSETTKATSWPLRVWCFD